VLEYCMEFFFYRFTARNRNPNSLCANIRISFNGTTKVHRKLLIFLLVYVQLTKKINSQISNNWSMHDFKWNSWCSTNIYIKISKCDLVRLEATRFTSSNHLIFNGLKIVIGINIWRTHVWLIFSIYSRIKIYNWYFLLIWTPKLIFFNFFQKSRSFI